MYINSVFIFFGIVSSQAQQIKGTVKEYSGKSVPRISIIVKTDKNSSSISEFLITDSEGNINYTLKKKYIKTIYLEASALSYEKAIDSIINPKADQVYTFDFTLYPKINELDEVVISERKKFNIKKDTVVFNVGKYKDGTERKVEDILQKLPGVEVAPSGSIKYKGKEVSAVQLDGDDLFGAKYSIGTKNISIDIVDQIEAIENYSKNPLLKGIENSGAVVLNLKLKKNKTDYSGTADLGYGYGDRNYVDATTTLIGVSDNLKSFGILGLNNTGNYPAFGRTSGSFLASGSGQTEDESDIFSKKIINETPITNSLGFKRSRIDERQEGSYNILYKFSEKAKVKANVIYLKDDVFQEEQFRNNFFFATETFGYTDRTQIIQKPEAKAIDLDFTFNTTKKSLLEIETSLSEYLQQSTNNFDRDGISNGTTGLSFEDFLFKNKLKYTHKVNKTNALQYVSLYSINNTPQEFKTIGNFFSTEDAINSYNQFSEYQKETFQNRLIWLGRKKATKYAFTLGIDHQKNPFESSLTENQILISTLNNNFEYQKTDYFSLFSAIYENKKWKFEPSLFLRYLMQDIDVEMNESGNQAKNSFVYEPSLTISHKISPVSKFNFSGSYEQNTPEENYLFSNGVITNNRTIQQNEVSLELTKIQKYSLGYQLNDLYHNIEANAIFGYTDTKNVFLSNLEVNNNVTSITFFQSPTDLNSLFANVSIERYLRFIQTTLKISSLYTVSEFKNFINQSELRDGISENYEGVLFVKTAFRIPINFENFLTYRINSFSINGQVSNTNYAVNNSFKTIIKPNKNWLFTFTYDYFKPNTRRNDDFSFLDFNIRYISKKYKWFSASIKGNNLLNNKVFEQVENSDFSTTIYQSNLIPRYFMLSLDLSF